MSAGSLSSVHDDNEAQANSKAAICHSKFYFDNELVIFQVEKTLFKVHKYQLLKSDVFSDMFGTARGDVEEGLSSEKPIVLDGVLKLDFEALLTVLYAPRFSTDQPELDSSFIVPAYRLANKWNFEDLRKCLIQLADKKLGKADRIVFAREFGMKDWLISSHTKLCQRPNPLTYEEAVKLGVHSVHLISRLREDVYRPSTAGVFTCAPCIGWNYYSQNSHCSKCQNRGHTLVSVQKGSVIDLSIESKVKKWVQNGCVFSG